MLSACSDVLVQRVGSFLPCGALFMIRKADKLLYRDLQSALVAAMSAHLGDAELPEIRDRRIIMRIPCGKPTASRALQALGKVAEKGDAGVIRAVSARLEDADEGVRLAAVEALGKVAEKGDAGAIAAVSARFEHEKPYVRQAAVQALGTIAEKGDAGVIRAVSARLEDAGEGVRLAAVEALGTIAEKGDAGVIRAVSARLDDAEWR